MRVMQSELYPWVKVGCLSYAKADRILGSPNGLRRFRERVAEAIAEEADEAEVRRRAQAIRARAAQRCQRRGHRCASRQAH